MESHALGETEPPLLEDTIGANLDAAVTAYGDRDALVECATGRRWTYAELGADVDALAVGLLRAGVGKGDRVGIWAPNCAEWTLTQYATAKIGAILVNINPAYRTHELADALNHAGCRLLISATEFKTSNYVEMLDSVRGELTSLEGTIYLGSPQWDTLIGRGDSTPTHRLYDRAPLLSFDDPINIHYTSGTTGFPKGETLSHHNILNNGYFVGELCGYTEDDRVCIPVPFYHCFGMVMGN